MICRWPHYADDGKDQEPCSLPETTDDEWDATAYPFDEVETWNRHCNIDSAQNELSLNRILDASGLENRSTVLKSFSYAQMIYGARLT